MQAFSKLNKVLRKVGLLNWPCHLVTQYSGATKGAKHVWYVTSTFCRPLDGLW